MNSTRILVVEDEAIVAMDIARRLSALGYVVGSVASTAHEAVRLAEEQRPDLVLMDIMLERDTDGIEAAATIHDRFRIPVIFLTAYGDSETLAKAKIASPYGYILKPFLDRDLQRTIELALSRCDIEARLEESAARFRGAFASSPIAMALVGPDGRFLEVNRSLGALLDYGEQELLALSPETLAHPDDAAQTRERLARVMSGESTTAELDTRSWEARFARKTGGDVWVSASASVVRGATSEPLYLVVQFQDITERRNAEEALEDREQHLRLAMETARLGTWDWNVETGAMRWQGPYDELFGLEAAGGTFDGFLQRVHPSDRARVESGARKAVETHTSFDEEFRLVRPDGAIRWAGAISKYYSADPAGAARMIGILQDVTARKEAEESQRRFEAEVQQSQKDQSLAVLAGGVAHDFNNLLVGVLGNAELALSQLPIESHTRRIVERIQLSALRAADLTQQMLAYVGKGKVVVGPVDVSALVSEISSLIAAAISGRAEYRFELAQGLPLIEADATQMRQVVMNLVTNAAEAIGPEGGSITLSTGAERMTDKTVGPWVGASELPEGEYIYFRVRDTGLGMTRSTQSRIFEPFFTTKFQGRGLGLSAVLGIVRGHGGAIRVESEPGKGTHVTAFFPRASTKERDLKGVSLDDQEVEKAPRAARILVVDDERVVREMIDDFLRLQGFAVVVADGGVEAVEILNREAGDIDLTLLDLTMPRMSGEEVLRRIRQSWPAVRVVLMSGYNEQEVMQKFAGSGLTGYVQKPFRLADLLSKIRTALSM